MLEAREGSPSDHQSKVFLGVRFVLLGFDSAAEANVRSKLINGGAVDAGHYGPSCTHVIVDKLVHDDSLCVSARSEGKTVVTGIWVDHSFEIGMPADTSSVLYSPLKDLNGIPGAKSLIVCLTGYQRQDRDDIMKMVGLMGAEFSKPLVANKVTHLICYKFEGEKYELAKKMKKIKLVNHRWLEDCLRAWKILPEGNYNKSGYELEVVEAEAKDSEEEGEEAAAECFRERCTEGAPNLQSGLMMDSDLPLHTGDIPKIHQTTAATKGLSNVVEDIIADGILLTTPKKEGWSDRALNLDDVNKRSFEEYDTEETRTKHGNTNQAEITISHDITPSVGKACSDLRSTTSSAKRSHPNAANLNALSYTRKTPRTSAVPVFSGEISSDLFGSPKGHLDECKAKDDLKLSPIKTKQKDRLGCNGIQAVQGGKLDNDGRDRSTSPQKRKVDGPGISSNSPNKRSHDLMVGASKMAMSTLGNSGHSMDGIAIRSPGHSFNNLSVNKSASFNNKTSACGMQVSETSTSETKVAESTNDKTPESSLMGLGQFNLSGLSKIGGVGILKTITSEIKVAEPSVEKTSEACFRGLGQSNFAGMSDIGDVDIARSINSLCKKGEPQKQHLDVKVSPVNTNNLEIEKSLGPNFDLQKGGNDDTILMRKIVTKKSLGSRRKFSAGNNCKRKGLLYPDRACTSIEAAVDPVDGEKSIEDEKIVFQELEKAEDVTQLGNEVMDKSLFMDDETEAPEDKGEGSENAINGKKCEVIEPICKTDMLIKKKAEVAHNSENKIKATDDSATFSVEDNDGIKLEKIISGKEDEVDEPGTIKVDMSKRRKLHSNKTKRSAVSAVKEMKISERGKIGEDFETKKAVVLHNSENKTDTVDEPTLDLKKGKDAAKLENAVSVKKVEMDESSLTADKVKTEMSKERKFPLNKTKKNAASAVTGMKTSKRGKYREELEVRTGDEKMVIEKVDEKPHPAAKSKSRNLAVCKAKDSFEVNKENMPVENGGSVNAAKKQNAKQPVNANKVLVKNNHMFRSTISIQVASGLKFAGNEPACFILSGHHLQRKEFQRFIKHLKGRFCRDSHHWSYQATHFVVPDPVRRTEKFFAAAASGRWILKTDYLTASNEAGRFLSEEPYEWFKNGLSEDGAINLQAPRKWRLLRERTGHGALHGMRVIIYGECIAPPLDTLKRVVKAGGGTILATSPPYTRFLKSGVDYAIVCPGMPRVDSWVQEFLRHEIPCVVADYLVEYVCKPGYSLERFVLYNTHAWAEKSFANMLHHSEDIVQESTPSDDDSGGDDDIACQACGTHDRWDMMLICGNESGSVGCGIGMHIDCCDPPLEDIPEEDWFCSKCTKSRNSSDLPNSKKKRHS